MRHASERALGNGVTAVPRTRTRAFEKGEGTRRLRGAVRR